MTRPLLVVFARAPRLGAVKRRLARGIGAAAALRFYRRTLATLMRRLRRERRWRTVLAVTPDRSARNARPWPRNFGRWKQGGGDLGQRMARVLRRAPPGPVAIVGADIPELSPAHVARAFRALGAADAVFGPAGDGGYWLIGLRARPLPYALFRAVRWSSAQALADNLANLRGRRVALIDPLDDIDDAAAWRRWRQRAASRVSSA